MTIKYREKAWIQWRKHAIITQNKKLQRISDHERLFKRNVQSFWIFFSTLPAIKKNKHVKEDIELVNKAQRLSRTQRTMIGPYAIYILTSFPFAINYRGFAFATRNRKAIIPSLGAKAKSHAARKLDGLYIYIVYMKEELEKKKKKNDSSLISRVTFILLFCVYVVRIVARLSHSSRRRFFSFLNESARAFFRVFPWLFSLILTPLRLRDLLLDVCDVVSSVTE